MILRGIVGQVIKCVQALKLFNLFNLVERDYHGHFKSHLHCGDKQQQLYIEFNCPLQIFEIKCSHCGEVLHINAECKLVKPNTNHVLRPFSRWQNYYK